MQLESVGLCRRNHTRVRLNYRQTEGLSQKQDEISSKGRSYRRKSDRVAAAAAEAQHIHSYTYIHIHIGIVNILYTIYHKQNISYQV